MKRRDLIWLTIGIMIGFLVIIGAFSQSYAAEVKKFRLTISGGTIGGSSNLVANAWAGVAKKYVNIDATVITYPTVAQVDAVLDGLAQIATGLPDVAQEAYEGIGAYTKKGPRRDLRAMCYRQGTILQFIAPKKSPIKTFRDLVGKRISAGKKGFSSDYNFMQLCKVLGLSYEKDFRIVYLGHSEAGSALTAGKLDAYIASASMPQPTMAEVDIMHSLTLVPLSEQDAQAAVKALRYYELVTIPPKYYHMSEPTLALNLPAFNVTTTSLSEDVVYKLVKNYIENPEFVGYHYKPLQELIESGEMRKWVENVGGIPWHAGSYRYFKEAGWKVHPDRIPPEIKGK